MVNPSVRFSGGHQGILCRRPLTWMFRGDPFGIQVSPGLSKQDSLVDCLGVLRFMETPPFRAELHLSAPAVA